MKTSILAIALLLIVSKPLKSIGHETLHTYEFTKSHVGESIHEISNTRRETILILDTTLNQLEQTHANLKVSVQRLEYKLNASSIPDSVTDLQITNGDMWVPKQ